MRLTVVMADEYCDRPVLNQSCFHYVEDPNGYGTIAKLRSQCTPNDYHPVSPPGLSFIRSIDPAQAQALTTSLDMLSNKADEVKSVRLQDGSLCLQFLYRSEETKIFAPEQEIEDGSNRNALEAGEHYFYLQEMPNPMELYGINALFKMAHPKLPLEKGQAWLKSSVLEACERFDADLGMASGLQDMFLPDLKQPGRKIDPLSVLGLRVGITGEFSRQGINAVINDTLLKEKMKKPALNADNDAKNKYKKYQQRKMLSTALASFSSLNLQSDFRQLDAILDRHSAPGGVSGTSETLRDFLYESFPCPGSSEYQFNQADFNEMSHQAHDEHVAEGGRARHAEALKACMVSLLAFKLIPSCKKLPGDEDEPIEDLGESLVIRLQTEQGNELEIEVNEDHEVHKQVCVSLGLSVYTPLEILFGEEPIAMGETFASSGIEDGARLGVIVTMELDERAHQLAKREAKREAKERRMTRGLHKYLSQNYDGTVGIYVEMAHFLLDLFNWSLGLASADRYPTQSTTRMTLMTLLTMMIDSCSC